MKRESSRSENGLRNIKVSLLVSVITILASFISRTVFVHHLSAEYLGLNSLFSNILSYLSLTELGIGSAVSFALYKPIKEGDNNKIRALMSEYQRLYVLVSAIIFLLGLLITPFLRSLIKEENRDIPLLEVYFLIYLLNLTMSLVLYCRRTIVICNQKEFILSFISGVFRLIVIAFQIGILVITGSYIGYLLVMLAFTIIEGIYVRRMTNRMYGDVFSTKAERLSIEERKVLKNNIFAIFMHKTGGVLVTSTDSIVISRFVGLYQGGLYSNYLLIIGAVTGILRKIFVSISASVGNLMAEDDMEHSEKVFYHILFLNCWGCGFISICFICLIQPFISAWIGTKYLLSDGVLYLAAASFYISMVRLPMIIFKEASGVFVQDRWKPIIEGAVNLAVSLILVQWYGISGVIIGTIFSDVAVAMWYEAKVFFRDRFNKGFGRYLAVQMGYLALNMSLALLSMGLCHAVTKGSLGDRYIFVIIVRLLICLVVPNVVYVLLFHKTESFRYFWKILRRR